VAVLVLVNVEVGKYYSLSCEGRLSWLMLCAEGLFLYDSLGLYLYSR
jgi:hypothetical protein